MPCIVHVIFLFTVLHIRPFISFPCYHVIILTDLKNKVNCVKHV